MGDSVEYEFLTTLDTAYLIPALAELERDLQRFGNINFEFRRVQRAYSRHLPIDREARILLGFIQALEEAEVHGSVWQAVSLCATKFWQARSDYDVMTAREGVDGQPSADPGELGAQSPTFARTKWNNLALDLARR